MKEGSVHEGVPFIADHQAAEVAQPGEGALDPPAPAVATKLPTVLGLGSLAVSAGGTDQFPPAFVQGLAQGIGVVGFVCDHPLWLTRRWRRGGLPQG